MMTCSCIYMWDAADQLVNYIMTVHKSIRLAQQINNKNWCEDMKSLHRIYLYSVIFNVKHTQINSVNQTKKEIIISKYWICREYFLKLGWEEEYNIIIALARKHYHFSLFVECRERSLLIVWDCDALHLWRSFTAANTTLSCLLPSMIV